MSPSHSSSGETGATETVSLFQRRLYSPGYVGDAYPQTCTDVELTMRDPLWKEFLRYI